MAAPAPEPGIDLEMDTGDTAGAISGTHDVIEHAQAADSEVDVARDAVLQAGVSGRIEPCEHPASIPICPQRQRFGGEATPSHGTPISRTVRATLTLPMAVGIRLDDDHALDTWVTAGGSRKVLDIGPQGREVDERLSAHAHDTVPRRTAAIAAGEARDDVRGRHRPAAVSSERTRDAVETDSGRRDFRGKVLVQMASCCGPSEQSTGEAGEHIAAPRRAEVSGRERVDEGVTARRGHHGARALEHHDGTEFAGGPARRREAILSCSRSTHVAECRELPHMRGQDCRRGPCSKRGRRT